MLVDNIVISVGSSVKLPRVGHLTEEKRLDVFCPGLIRSLIPAQVSFMLYKLSEKNLWKYIFFDSRETLWILFLQILYNSLLPDRKANSSVLLISLSRE